MPTTLLHLVAPVRGRLITAVVLAAAASLCSLVPLVAVAFIAQTLLSDEGSGLDIWVWTALGVAGAVARVVLNAWATSISHRADADFRATVRRRVTAHLARLPLGWFSRNASGAVKKAVGDDVRRMHVVVAHLAADVTTAVLTPVCGLILLGLFDWRLMLALLGYLVLVSVITLPAASRSMSTYYDQYDAAVLATTSATVELVDGIEVVKAFSGQSRETSRFHRAVDDWVRICLLWTRAGSRPASLLGILTSPASMTVWILLVASLFVAIGWVEPWTAVPFLLIGVAIPGSFQQLGAMTNAIRQAAVAAHHVGTVLEEAPLSVSETPAAVTGHVVEFENVSFTYPGSRHPALTDISMRLSPGTVTALVGGSGSGKSTVARLIPRFYDATTGSVRLGGRDVRELDPADVLRNVAIVFQDATLISGTVRDNLLLARPAATEDQIENALTAARLTSVVDRLPNGLDTVIGSGGADLSGGERQRITIARAMLQDAPIVLLDEATAHVDPHGEVEIQRALATLATARAVLVIAHRLRTVEHADQIIVLDSGRIVERGTHDELVMRNGRYASLLRRQQLAYEGVSND